MINHIVLMKFKPDVSEAAISKLETLLDDLPNRIFEIQMYEIGPDLVRSELSYDYALVALFANLETLQRYQEHPEHRAAVKEMNALCENIAIVDFEGSDAGSLKEPPPEKILRPLR